jgi:hypothetical protein
MQRKEWLFSRDIMNAPSTKFHTINDALFVNHFQGIRHIMKVSFDKSNTFYTANNFIKIPFFQ